MFAVVGKLYSEGSQRGQAWAGCGWVVRALSDSPIFFLECLKIMSKGLFSRKKTNKQERGLRKLSPNKAHYLIFL